MNNGSLPSPNQPQSGQTQSPHGDTPTSGLRTGGLHTEGLHPKGLPAPSFPEVGRIPKAPFTITSDPLPQRRFTGTLPPFWPVLRGEPASAYSFTLTRGYVNERIAGPDDALAKWLPFNLLWGADAVLPDRPNELRKFAIAVGQQISIVVKVLPTGDVGLPVSADPSEHAVMVVVEAENAESSHYVPPCADDTFGSVGEYHYKMAVLQAATATAPVSFLMFLAGSHLDHFGYFLHNNTANPAPAGSGRVIKEYNQGENRYLHRLIRAGGSQAQVIEHEDDIEVRGNEKYGALIFTDCEDNEVARLEWDDGYITTTGTQIIKAGCNSSPNNNNS